jgi:FkbM family methyltransferase
MLPQVNLIRANNGDFLSFFERAGISGVLTAHGVWDELTIGIAKVLIDNSNKTPSILDIGSNMGTFAIPIGKYIQDKGGFIHCFEPQRIISYQLSGNIFLNRLDNAFVHRVALSDWTGWDEIQILDYNQAWNIGAYSLVPNMDTQEKQKMKELVNFYRIDDYSSVAEITLVKIDVEGMELNVLKGGGYKLKENKYPPILFESLSGDPNAAAVMNILFDMGYKCSQYANEDWLAQHHAWDSEINLIVSENKISYSKIR